MTSSQEPPLTRREARERERLREQQAAQPTPDAALRGSGTCSSSSSSSSSNPSPECASSIARSSRRVSVRSGAEARGAVGAGCGAAGA